MTASSATTPDFSVVVPVFDEGGAAPHLAREIATAFAGENYEMIFVDDASRDDTKALLTALKAEIPQLRVLGHRKNSGQSRAVRSGILAARGPIIVTLDGDGQNDPADAPRLAKALAAGPANWPWSAASGSSARTATPSALPPSSATACASGS
jgi:dolichol-phosphate mannosyltransferase